MEALSFFFDYITEGKLKDLITEYKSRAKDIEDNPNVKYREFPIRKLKYLPNDEGYSFEEYNQGSIPDVEVDKWYTIKFSIKDQHILPDYKKYKDLFKRRFNLDYFLENPKITKQITERLKSFEQQCQEDDDLGFHILPYLKQFCEFLQSYYPVAFEKKHFKFLKSVPKSENTWLPEEAKGDLEKCFFFKGKEKPITSDINLKKWTNILTGKEQQNGKIYLNYDPLLVDVLLHSLAYIHLSNKRKVKPFLETIEKLNIFIYSTNNLSIKYNTVKERYYSAQATDKDLFNKVQQSLKSDQHS